MNSSDKNDWKKLPLMLEVVEKTCYWHDDVKCPDHCDCEICGHQPPDDEKEVILNRPFVFAILHRTMNIPVFVGIVNHLEED